MYGMYTDMKRVKIGCHTNMPRSALKNSIKRDKRLVDYNKKEIKQLGTCVLKVNYGDTTLPQEFFVVGSGFRPIVGLDVSIN